MARPSTAASVAASHTGVFDTIGFLTALVLQLASIVVAHALYCIRSVRRSLTELKNFLKALEGATKRGNRAQQQLA
jgi:hypothetical protein